MEWSTGLIDNGHQVEYLPVPERSILELNGQFDVLIYAGIPIQLLSEFDKFKSLHPHVKIIGATDHWEDYYRSLKGVVDFFIGCIDCVPTVRSTFQSNGFSYYEVPLAGNHRLFRKLDEKKIYDACFIGNLSHGYRGEDKFLYPILDDPKFTCFLGGMTYKNYTRGFVDYQSHNLVRNQTRVNLNFHVPYQKPNTGIPKDRVDLNQSVYNIALSGNFQLCDHPWVDSMFNGNVVVGNEENWKELFEYYLSHEDEREALSYNARIIAERDHTWKVRMDHFINTTFRNHYEK